MFFDTQKGKVVMRNILGPICIVMFVASFGGFAGTNPFDNPADSNTATIDETSNNTTGTTDNTDGSGNRDTSENTVTSISFGGATPPNGNSVVNVTSENNSIIRTFDGVRDMRYAIENGNEVLYIDNLGFDGNASDPHTKVTNFGGFGTQDIYATPVTVVDPQNGQISMTGEYLGMRTRKGAADGEYVIAELFFDVDLQDPNKSRSTQFRMVNRTRYSMESGQSLEGTRATSLAYPTQVGLLSKTEWI